MNNEEQKTNYGKEIEDYSKDYHNSTADGQQPRPKNPRYMITRQNETLVNISQQLVGVNKSYVQLDFDGNYTTKDLISKSTYLTINKKPIVQDLQFLDNFKEAELKENLENIYKTIDQSTAKLLDIFIAKLVEQGNIDASHSTISIDVKEYAKILNGGNEPTRSQVNKAREKIKRGVEALKYISYSYKKGTTNHLNVSIYGGTEAINNGKVFFKFNSDFIALNFYTQGYLNVVPISVLSLNENNNPHAYLMAKKMLSLRRNNRGDKYRETTFKVKTLYDYVISLPRYKNSEGKIVCKNPTDRIIKPFEDTLDALSNTNIFKWQYDKEYTDKTADANYKLAFEDFENASIIVEWNKDFDEQDKSIIEGRKEHEQKKLKAASKKAKK